MSTLNWNRIFSALVCLTLILTLPNGNVSASPTLQGEADFAAIDAYVTEQMNRLGIPGMALGHCSERTDCPCARLRHCRFRVLRCPTQ